MSPPWGHFWGKVKKLIENSIASYEFYGYHKMLDAIHQIWEEGTSVPAVPSVISGIVGHYQKDCIIFGIITYRQFCIGPVQWVVKKIKWGGLVRLVSIRGRWVSVRQNSLRLGERGSPSTQLLQTIQTHRKNTQTHRQRYRQRKTRGQNERESIMSHNGK